MKAITSNLLSTSAGRIAAALAVASWLCAGAVLAGGDTKAYRYVDENGNVVYQDHFPPDAATKERERFNQYGVPEEQLPAELTREEQIRREVERRLQEARDRERQQRQDRMRKLHRSFPQEGDLRHFHESQIEQIYLRISNNDRKLDQLRRRLLELEEQAAGYNYPPRGDSDLPPLPESLLEDMLNATKRITEREEDAANMREQLEKQRMRYEEDLELYRDAVQAGGRDDRAPAGGRPGRPSQPAPAQDED